MSYEPSEQVKRTQKILESIEERKLLRIRLVGEMNSKDLELKDDIRAAENRWNHEMKERRGAIAKVDVALEQLRRQLESELHKLDPVIGVPDACQEVQLP